LKELITAIVGKVTVNATSVQWDEPNNIFQIIQKIKSKSNQIKSKYYDTASSKRLIKMS
jgi:hypothetical protein